MLRKATLFLLLSFCTTAMQAAPKQIQVFFSFGIFSTSDGKPYVEVYVRIPSSTLNYSKTPDKKFVAAAKAQLYVMRNDTVFFQNQYTLKTLPLTDTVAGASMVDIKRFEMPNGRYEMVLFVEDERDSMSNAHIDIPIQVSVAKDQLQMADVLFCDTLYPVSQPDEFTRFGYNFIPTVSNILPKERNSLLFYTEIYNTLVSHGQGDFKYTISVKNNAGMPVKGFEKMRTQKSQKLNYIFDAVDISKLPGGEYYLQVAVLDKANRTIARRDKYFVRLTDNFMTTALTASTAKNALSVQQIKDFVPYLEPIASAKEVQDYSRASGRDSISLQQWFYNFWKSRNEENPEKAYTDYLALVTEVQKSFGTMLSQGYRTDRGRVYLKYGKPDYVTPYLDEPNSYPYEIWHYYKTATRNNVKFIFYNPTQLNNDYILVHSDMPSETQNPNWKRMIYRRTDKSKSIEEKNSPNNFGDEIDRRIKE